MYRGYNGHIISDKKIPRGVTHATGFEAQCAGIIVDVFINMTITAEEHCSTTLWYMWRIVLSEIISLWPLWT